MPRRSISALSRYASGRSRSSAVSEEPVTSTTVSSVSTSFMTSPCLAHSWRRRVGRGRRGALVAFELALALLAEPHVADHDLEFLEVFRPLGRVLQVRAQVHQV